MLLVLVSALGLGVWDQAGRMIPLDWEAIRGASILLVPFLIMVGLKLGLVVAMRAGRSAPGVRIRSEAGDEPPP